MKAFRVLFKILIRSQETKQCSGVGDHHAWPGECRPLAGLIGGTWPGDDLEGWGERCGWGRQSEHHLQSHFLG